ncbi:MAG: dihydropteroate synthase, partial [Lachnospiraceae bacterium]|nr:dihydropteroate synthase [Lachnospiraceae bacterium]
MKIGSREFDVKHHTYVVGILNVTPDSFSDGGKFDTLDRAMEHVERMIAEGADMIDVGGESTRPGYQPVSAKEEIERVLPVIRKIKTTYD